MYIPPYYLGIFVGAVLTIATEIAIVMYVDKKDKERKEKMRENFSNEKK